MQFLSNGRRSQECSERRQMRRARDVKERTTEFRAEMCPIQQLVVAVIIHLRDTGYTNSPSSTSKDLMKVCNQLWPVC